MLSPDRRQQRGRFRNLEPYGRRGSLKVEVFRVDCWNVSVTGNECKVARRVSCLERGGAREPAGAPLVSVRVHGRGILLRKCLKVASEHL